MALATKRINQLGSIVLSVFITVVLTGTAPAVSSALQPFSVREAIGVGVFGDNAYTGKIDAITWSPDRAYFAVHVGRGLLRTDRVQSELRIYRVFDVENFLNSRRRGELRPYWDIELHSAKEGPIIQHLSWNDVSEGFAFLAKTEEGTNRLMYADIKHRTLMVLSKNGQDVTGFDVRDGTHYVYAVRALLSTAKHTKTPIVRDLTGARLEDLLFPIRFYPQRAQQLDRSVLWNANGGTPKVTVNVKTGAPIVVFDEGVRDLRLSPNAKFLVSALPVKSIPVSWEKNFLPPNPNLPYRIRQGKQITSVDSGFNFTSRFVILDLASGSVIGKIDGPTASAASWLVYAKPAWSRDSEAVVLPGSFLTKNSDTPSVPCVVVYSLVDNNAQCVEKFSAQYLPNGLGDFSANRVVGTHFVGARGTTLAIAYEAEGQSGIHVYHRDSAGIWSILRTEPTIPDVLRVTIEQSAEDPPTLVASYNGIKKILWNPNPQLKDVAIGKVETVRWKDKTGRSWLGGLYEPPGYSTATRYPLVIQAHGFFPGYFRPSGMYPTAYAARALAAAGFIVLETRCTVGSVTEEEGPCTVDGYESAIEMLGQKGLIDPSKVGLLGFSRACYYVLEALTSDRIPVAAASITDGINAGYWEYLVSSGTMGEIIANEDRSMNGGDPWGQGIEKWTQLVPTFRMDMVKAPLQIVGEGMESVFDMWEPYALLRFQGKPVDLVLLDTDEHVLTNPRVRVASQGSTVDWFRFWLQGYEDPAPQKAAMYRRWEKLCDQQIAEKTGRSTFCVPTGH